MRTPIVRNRRRRGRLTEIRPPIETVPPTTNSVNRPSACNCKTYDAPPSPRVYRRRHPMRYWALGLEPVPYPGSDNRSVHPDRNPCCTLRDAPEYRAGVPDWSRVEWDTGRLASLPFSLPSRYGFGENVDLHANPPTKSNDLAMAYSL